MKGAQYNRLLCLGWWLEQPSRAYNSLNSFQCWNLSLLSCLTKFCFLKESILITYKDGHSKSQIRVLKPSTFLSDILFVFGLSRALITFSYQAQHIHMHHVYLPSPHSEILSSHPQIVLKCLPMYTPILSLLLTRGLEVCCSLFSSQDFACIVKTNVLNNYFELEDTL